MSSHTPAGSARLAQDTPRMTGLRGGGFLLWRLLLPVLWVGMLLAISFLEAPLKFQAPGITIPLGLGIGRLVFQALNIAEGVILLALLVCTLWPRVSHAVRATRAQLVILGSLAVVFLLKLVVIRPPLNARTDLVLAGANPGESPWHYWYIAADVVTLLLLVTLIVLTARQVRARLQPASL